MHGGWVALYNYLYTISTAQFASIFESGIYNYFGENQYIYYKQVKVGIEYLKKSMRNDSLAVAYYTDPSNEIPKDIFTYVAIHFGAFISMAVLLHISEHFCSFWARRKVTNFSVKPSSIVTIKPAVIEINN